MKTCSPTMLLCLAVAIGLAAFDARPALAQKTVTELKTEADKLVQDIDKALQWYFRYQVQAGWYRNRLGLLQEEWQKLLGGLIPQKAARKFPPPPRRGFRIDAAIGSDAITFNQSLFTRGCKKRKDCKVWVRISFSPGLVARGAQFEVSIDLMKGTRRYAVPGKSLAVRAPVMLVDVPLDRSGIYKGKYTGTVRVLAGGRYASKSLAFELFKTW